MGKFIDRTGEVYIFSDGRTMKITEYFNNKNISVMFNDGSIVSNRYYEHFLSGAIKNNNRPIVHGVGYIGNGSYSSKINGKSTKIYSRWKNIMQRCYSVNRQQKQVSYETCTIHKDWHNFQNFARWFEENYIEGFELDKDILFKGNKIYSIKTCCFVPFEINVLLTNRYVCRGDFPLGVSFYKKNNKFMACLHINSIQKHLGYFYTQEEAFNAYKNAKEENIKNVANKYKNQITIECYNALMDWTIDIND